MAEPKVRTSTMDWATQVNLVRAAQQLDAARGGVVAVDALQEPAYEFSGGRTFVQPKPLYGPEADV